LKSIYLACPFSAKDNPALMAYRVAIANKVAGRLMKLGYAVFSPLSHSVPIADHIGNHLSHGFWLKQDLYWLAKCDILVVICLPGWTQSFGVNEEIRKAQLLRIPIYYLKMKGDSTYCQMNAALAPNASIMNVRLLSRSALPGRTGLMESIQPCCSGG